MLYIHTKHKHVHSWAQDRTKWRNCRLTPETPDYQLGWASNVHIVENQFWVPPLRSSLTDPVVWQSWEEGAIGTPLTLGSNGPGLLYERPRVMRT